MVVGSKRGRLAVLAASTQKQKQKPHNIQSEHNVKPKGEKFWRSELLSKRKKKKNEERGGGATSRNGETPQKNAGERRRSLVEKEAAATRAHDVVVAASVTPPAKNRSLVAGERTPPFQKIERSISFGKIVKREDLYAPLEDVKERHYGTPTKMSQSPLSHFKVAKRPRQNLPSVSPRSKIAAGIPVGKMMPRTPEMRTPVRSLHNSLRTAGNQESAAAAAVAGEEKDRRSGFRNVGNTCYLNAVTSVVLHLQRLSAEILQRDNAVCQALSNLLRKKGSGNILNPVAVKECISEFSEQFANNEQQDAHEFWLLLLEKLETKLFTGSIEHVFTCEACKHRTSTEETFNDISLNVTDDSGLNIQSLLSQHFETSESVTKDCDRCDEGKSATHTSRIVKLPSILVLHLKRLTFVGSGQGGSGSLGGLQKSHRKIHTSQKLQLPLRPAAQVSDSSLPSTSADETLWLTTPQKFTDMYDSSEPGEGDNAQEKKPVPSSSLKLAPNTPDVPNLDSSLCSKTLAPYSLSAVISHLGGATSGKRSSSILSFFVAANFFPSFPSRSLHFSRSRSSGTLLALLQ